MWSFFHFVFLYFCAPTPLMHWYACALFVILSFYHKKRLSSRDIAPCLCTVGMYIGFYLTRELYHWACLPWWVTTLCGFRKQRGYIWFGGVVIGFLLHAMSWRQRIGHCLMNVCRMFLIKEPSLGGLGCAHLCLFILFGSMDGLSTERWWIDVMGALSCMMCLVWKSTMEWFSMAMLFTNPLSTGLFVLHIGKWFDYYKNNHYRRVKYTFYYVYPVLILLVLFVREEITLLRWKTTIVSS